jgi:mitogen-activated protein kinase kinase
MFQPKTLKRRNLKKLTLADESKSPLAAPSVLSAGSKSLQTPRSILSSKSSEDLELVETFGKLSVSINKEFTLKQQDLLTLKSLGEGQSGVVSKVLHVPTNKIMAKKQIMFEKNFKVQNQILRELKILTEVNSPYIIKFYGAMFVDMSSSSSASTITPTMKEQDDQKESKQAVIADKSTEESPTLTCNGVIICMEYMDCGSLDYILKKLGPLKEVYLSKITHNILQGLNYLYATHKIIHRDIKPSNVLLSSKGDVKICDFGVSRELNNNSIADTFVGTSTYMSPERIQGDVYSIKGDVWSLGLMLIELSTGEFPLGKKDTPNGILDLLQRIVNEEPPSLSRKRYSKELCDFVEVCLKKQHERPTPLELLNMPSGFLKKYDKEESAPLLRHLAKKLKKPK